METTRCFIALDLPRNVLCEVERVQEEIRKKKIFSGKFVEIENLHLTLKFLGEIDVEKLEKVKEMLKEIKFSKFDVRFGELGVFNSQFIRIIWIKVLGKQIWDLQKEIDCKLKDLFEKEERFMSHLTIARVKSVKDKKIFLEELKKINVQEIEFNIDCFYLIKSELKPEGPVYSIIEKFEMNSL